MYVKKEKKREIKDRILLQSISPESLVYLFNYGKQLTRPRLSLIFTRGRSSRKRTRAVPTKG